MPTLYARTLCRAAEVVGGEHILASHLKVARVHLKLWIKGLAYPPGDIFLKAADIVCEHELKEISDDPGHAH